jgi:hypothetical protein
MNRIVSIGPLLPLLLSGCTAGVDHVGESQTEHVGEVKQALSGESCQLIWTAEAQWFCDSMGERECNGTCRDGSEPRFSGYSCWDDDCVTGGCSCSCCDPPEPDPCRWNGWWCS